MGEITDLLGAALLLIGAGFFTAGSLGVLRFPDVYSRLHALTKADNLGLGCVLLGLAITASDAAVAGKLVFVWLAALVASATSCYLIGGTALRRAPRSGSGRSDAR